MSAYIRNMKATVQTCDSPTCNPKPAQAGLLDGCVVDILGMVDYSETSEAYFLIANEGGEFWFLPTRHFRFYEVTP